MAQLGDAQEKVRRSDGHGLVAHAAVGLANVLRLQEELFPVRVGGLLGFGEQGGTAIHEEDGAFRRLELADAGHPAGQSPVMEDLVGAAHGIRGPEVVHRVDQGEPAGLRRTRCGLLAADDRSEGDETEQASHGR